MKPYYDHAGITIYHGDCREVMGSMPEDSIDIIWTDPPYGHSNHDGDFNSRLNSLRGIDDKPIANDSRDLMRETVDTMLLEAARVLKRDCCCCCCCGGGGPSPTFAWLALRMDDKGLRFFHSCIWDKRNPGLGWRFRRQHEMVMVAHRKGGKLKWADDASCMPNILSYYPPRDRLHPNEKPIDMVSAFLAKMATPDSVVLDPFMGAGTTLVAAKAMGLRCIGIELEESYCEIAANRLAQEVLPFA